MAYIGTEVARGFATTAKQSFSGDASTVAFTLTKSAARATDLEIFVDNVQQEPTTAYGVSGTTLTFTAAPSAGTNNIYVVHRDGSAVGLLPPQDLGTRAYTFGGNATINGGTLNVSGAPFTIANTNNGNNIDIKTTSGSSLVHAVKIHSGGLFEVKVGFTAAAGADIITATAGTSNLRLGVNAGDSIASGGNYNVVLGDEAGTALTTGDSNVAIGFEALATEDTNGLNVAVGYQALKTLNAGGAAYNVAIGYTAGTAITTSQYNTIVGGLAADALTTGNENTAVGVGALGTETAGDRNVAIGNGALSTQNTTGGGDIYNIGIGYNAGTAVTTGVNNVIIGGLAGDAITSANSVVAVGLNAAGKTTTGGNNVAIGQNALATNISSVSNVAVGHESLLTTTGGYNTAVGFQALRADTTGTYNTAVGQTSLDACTTGGSNVAVGSSALGALTEAAGVVAVGNSAGAAHLTVAGGTYIGHVAGFNSTALNTCIGYLSAYSDNGSTSLRAGSGNTLVGSYTSVHDANAAGTVVIGHSGVAKGNNTSFLIPNSGTFQGNNQTAFSQTSDRRLKKNITDSSIGLAEINQLKVRNFEYKTKDELSEIKTDGLVEDDIIKVSGVQVGLVAQEIQAVLPKCVIEQSTGVLSLDADNLTWHLIKAVQELSTALDAAVSANTALVARVKTLEDA